MPQLASRPGDVWAPSSCFLSGELKWLTHCKPPDVAVSTQQYLHDVISATFAQSVTWHPLRASTGHITVPEFDLSLADLRGIPNELSIPELADLTVIMQCLFTLREINQMEREMCLHSCSHSKVLNAQVLKPPSWAALRRLLNGVIDKLEMRQKTSCSPNRLTRARPPVVLCCSHTAFEIGSY